MQQTDYYPFGLEIKRLEAVPNKYLFNGIEKNDALNTYEARFRELDPVIGRWWMIDPKPTDAISPYSIMLNNPVRYTDPFGDTTNYYNQYTGAYLGTIYGNDNYGDRFVEADTYNKMVASNNKNLNSAITSAIENMNDPKEIAAKITSLTSTYTNSLEDNLGRTSFSLDLGSQIGLLARIGFAEFRGSNTIEQQVGMDITLNRVGQKGFRLTLEGVIRQPWQYSSLNSGNPNKPFF